MGKGEDMESMGKRRTISWEVSEGLLNINLAT